MPFSLFWFLLAAGHPGWAIFGALALSAAGNAWRAPAGNWLPWKPGRSCSLPRLASLSFRRRHSPPQMLCGYPLRDLAPSASQASLRAGLGLATIRASRTRENAATPQFRMINAAITGLWGVLFLALGVCRYLGLPGMVRRNYRCHRRLDLDFRAAPCHPFRAQSPARHAGDFPLARTGTRPRQRRRLRRCHRWRGHRRIDGGGVSGGCGAEGRGLRPSRSGRRLLPHLCA